MRNCERKKGADCSAPDSKVEGLFFQSVVEIERLPSFSALAITA